MKSRDSDKYEIFSGGVLIIYYIVQEGILIRIFPFHFQNCVNSAYSSILYQDAHFKVNRMFTNNESKQIFLQYFALNGT